MASFTGLARAEAGAATALELEAYPGFTEAEIGKIAEAAKAALRLHDCLVVHRTGEIAPGEAIVFVATAAAHRREAFEACDYLMDYLKSRAPVLEEGARPDGARWVEPTARDLADGPTPTWERPWGRQETPMNAPDPPAAASTRRCRRRCASPS